MSESSNETPEVGLIPDEDPPEPPAGDPSPAGGSGGSAEGKVEGMPDMGEPGA